MSLRDRILAADDIGRRTVEVPEWDAEVEVRTMTAAARSAMLKRCTDQAGNLDTEKLYVLLVISSTFDPETGDKLFTESDTGPLGEKSAAAVETVARAVMEMSGMTPGEVDEEGKDS